MFIDGKQNEGALRQEGHVSLAGSTRKINMALLTEGWRVSKPVL
jgi:hypothetical protein